MINCLIKKETMSISEFLEASNTSSNKLEALAIRIKSNRILEKAFVFTIGLVMMNTGLASASTVAIETMTSIGTNLFTIVQVCGYSLIPIMGIIEIVRIRMLGKEDRNKKTAIAAMKCSLELLAFYLFPVILKLML